MKIVTTALCILALTLVACTPVAPQGRGMMNNQQPTSAQGQSYEQTAPADLPLAQPTQVVTLQDGDRYAINAHKVQKTIAGKTVTMYGYNGQVPGPLLRVEKNTTITIDFTNNLGKETTVHWHGLRLDINSDGVPFDVNGHGTQKPIADGETYSYTLTFPDEGVYWYHPHVKEEAQQDLGLYGNIFVKEPIPSGSPVSREEFLVLDDILLDDNGIVPYGTDYVNYAIMGRFGNIQLVNGETHYTLSVKRGAVVRFYLTNVANVRPFHVEIPGAKIKLVGGDSGAYEREEMVDHITIAPAERYTIDVLFDQPGTYQILNANPLRTYTLGTVTVRSEQEEESIAKAFSTLHENNVLQADLKRLQPEFTRPVDETLVLDIDMPGMMHGGMAMMQDSHDGIEWEDTMPMMNSRFTSKDLTWFIRDNRSGKKNMDLTLTATVGDVKKYRIVNPTNGMHPMQHPIHLHGQRFIVLSIDGKTVTNHVWKDTVLVPIGSTVDILVEFTNPGDWMLHCHIAEHLMSGMMTHIEVRETTNTEALH